MAHYIIEKEGNYMLVPLPDEAWAILQSQLINKNLYFRSSLAQLLLAFNVSEIV